MFHKRCGKTFSSIEYETIKKGIWSIENYATDSGFDKNKAANSATPASASKQSQPAPTEASQKQNRNSRSNNNQITTYHRGNTILAAGFSNIPKGHPAYSSKLDRG